jgi:transcriptional antiterminator RfaH
MENSFWYVAQTKPRQEDIALVNLERQGFVVNLPRIPRIKPSPRLPDTEVLFPGYIFFAPHAATQSISPVRSTTGVSRVVRFGQEAATLSANVLDQILSFINDLRAAPSGLAALCPARLKRAMPRETIGTGEKFALESKAVDAN